MTFDEMRKQLLKQLAVEEKQAKEKAEQKKIQFLKRKVERHNELFNKNNSYSVLKENDRMKSEFKSWNSSGWKQNGSYKQPIKHKLY